MYITRVINQIYESGIDLGWWMSNKKLRKSMKIIIAFFNCFVHCRWRVRSPRIVNWTTKREVNGSL